MKIVVMAGGPAQSCETLIEPYKDSSTTFFVGVDRGAYHLMQLKLPVNLAIGDFDSLSVKEFKTVSNYADDLYRSPAEKDDTDFELAMLAILQRIEVIDEIIVFGGIGGRFDHQIQLFYLVLQERFAALIDKLVFIDHQNRIQFVTAGCYHIEKDPDMTYLAFAGLTPVSNFSIRDAKYELSNKDFVHSFSLSSNEFIGTKQVGLSFEKGIVAIIQSKD